MSSSHIVSLAIRAAPPAPAAGASPSVAVVRFEALGMESSAVRAFEQVVQRVLIDPWHEALDGP